MGFCLRDATSDDIDDIYRIELMSFAYPWEKGTFINELKLKFSRLKVVLNEKNRIVAFINYWLLLDEINILNIAVDPEYRRMGIAELMVKSVINEMGSMNLSKIFLEVRKSNFSAISLYEKLGFKYFAERKGYYENGEDALTYILNQ